MTVGAAVEIGSEHLDGGARPVADSEHAAAKVVGAAVGQVVARDRSDDDMAQAQASAGLGHTRGFVVGDRLGLASLHGAEAAGASACLAQDHERGGAAGPAF